MSEQLEPRHVFARHWWCDDEQEVFATRYPLDICEVHIGAGLDCGWWPRPKGEPMSQRPQIRAGGLSGRIFAITSFNKFSDGRIEAKEKFDVTEDVLAAVRETAVLRQIGLLLNDDEFIPMEIVRQHLPFAAPEGVRVRAVYEIADGS